MKKIILIMSFAMMLFGQTKLPLPEVIERGLADQSQYQIGQINIQQTDLDQQIAKDNKRFKVQASGSYLYKSDLPEMKIDAITAGGVVVFPGLEKEVGVHGNADFKVALVQPIYTGGMLDAAVKQKEILQAIQVSANDLTELQYSANVKQSYFTLNLLFQKQKSLMKLQNQLDIHIEKIRFLLMEELISKSDLLETRKKLEELKISLSEIEQAIQSESISFRELTGIDFSEVESGYFETAASADSAVAWFEKHHPVMAQLSQQENMISVKNNVLAGQYRPQVSGFVESHYGRPGLNYFGEDWQFYWQGGVSVSMPVFDWKHKKKARQINELDSRKISEQKAEYLRQTRENLDKLTLELDKVDRQLETLKSLSEIAAEEQEIKNRLYAEKQISNLDYLAAVCDAGYYRSRLLENEYQRQLICVTINRISGKQ